MKPTRDTRRFLKIPHIDGIATRFPVSDFVLNLTQPAKRQVLVLKNIATQSAAAFLTIVLCASSAGLTFANPMQTLSYFRDDESSLNNIFAAGRLGFRLNPGDVTIPISEGDHISIAPLFAPDADSFEIAYRIHAEVVGEHTPLCLLLQAMGTTSPYFYEGAFATLSAGPATTTGHGHIDVTLPNAANLPSGMTCTIAIVYKGWYQGAPESSGYTDEERDTFTFVYAPSPSAQQAALSIAGLAPEEATPLGEVGASSTLETIASSTESNITDSPEMPNVSTSTPDLPADSTAVDTTQTGLPELPTATTDSSVPESTPQETSTETNSSTSAPADEAVAPTDTPDLSISQ